MKERKQNFLIFFFCILLIGILGCSNSNGLQYIDETYSMRAQNNSTILILPINDKVTIKNTFVDSLNILEKDYSSSTFREKEVFNNYIPLLLKEKTHSTIVDRIENISFEKLKYENHTTVLNNHSIQFMIPETDDLTIQKERVDFLLLFDDLGFSKNYSVEGSSLGRVGQASYTLKIGFEYLIWDFKNQKVAGYGRISQKAKLLVVPQKEDFIQVLDKLVEILIQKSPFIAKKIYF